MSTPRLKVKSTHPAFAPVDSVREVTQEEATLLCMIGRAQLLRASEREGLPARQIVPVTKAPAVSNKKGRR